MIHLMGRSRIWLLVRLVLVVGIIVVTVGPEWPAFGDTRFRFQTIIGREQRFDFVTWTAEALGQALSLVPQLVPEMRERRYGIFEGFTYAEAQARYPDGYAAFEGRNASYNFENGESLVEMFERVTGKLKEIAVEHSGQNVAVVLHGGVLDIINRFVRGNSLETPRDFLIPNAGLNWIAAVNGKWRLESWGETAHLEPGALDELPS